MNYCEKCGAIYEEAVCPRCAEESRRSAQTGQRTPINWLENSKIKLEQSVEAWNASPNVAEVPQEESDLSLVERKLRKLEAEDQASPDSALKDLDILVKAHEERDVEADIYPEEEPQTGTLLDLEEKIKAIEQDSGAAPRATPNLDPYNAPVSDRLAAKRAALEKMLAEEQLKGIELGIEFQDPNATLASPLQELNEHLERRAARIQTQNDKLIFEFESRNFVMADSAARIDTPYKALMLVMSLIMPYIFLITAIVFIARGNEYRRLGVLMAALCTFMIAVHMALIMFL
ncbi:MAG: hypothetical protein LBC41_03820 [Clostridiales bacterium]|jgi:hypothetical protein|nr:hypothetical protein [Clostridiales bacterium]